MAGVPLEAELEPDRMTDAPVFNSGKTFCTVKMVPPTLRLNVSRSAAVSYRPTGRTLPTGIREHDVKAVSVRLDGVGDVSRSSGSVTSPGIPVAECPIDASASSRRPLSRPVMKTCAPSAANAWRRQDRYLRCRR